MLALPGSVPSVGQDGLPGAILVAPIPQHDNVATRVQLPNHAHRNHVTRVVHNLRLKKWQFW